MAIEAYIPQSVEFAGTTVADVMVITLYAPDHDESTGSLTGPHPLAAESRGSLTFVGRRDGKEWRVTLADARVTNRTALGCEFAVRGAAQREVLRELDDAARKGPREKGMEEQFDIR